MRTISKVVGLSMALLALPALAQTVDGGQGIACNVDTDCPDGGGACGWVCDWDAVPHVCTPAINQAEVDGQSEGWCDNNSQCSCSGQTCGTNNFCTPAVFANTTPLCICDSDCSGSHHCDQTLQVCAPAVTACNYDGQCGCGCSCVAGACVCTVVGDQTCATQEDCNPQGCNGSKCVDGGCVIDGFGCLSPTVDAGCSVDLTCPTGCNVGTDCTCIPQSATAGAGSACQIDADCCTGTCVGGFCTSPGSGGTSGGSSGGTSGGGASTGGSSSGSSGGCAGIGSPCIPGTIQCCANESCVFNGSGGGTGADSHCVARAAATSGGSTGGGTSGGSSGRATGGASGGATGGADAGNGSGGGGCGCATNSSGAGGLALLALGLAVLSRRKHGSK